MKPKLTITDAHRLWQALGIYLHDDYAVSLNVYTERVALIEQYFELVSDQGELKK
jgi:hypothetical protein